jgi:large subunit ribosomal protein L7/L12
MEKTVNPCSEEGHWLADVDVSYNDLAGLCGAKGKLACIMTFLKAFWVGDAKGRSSNVRIGSVRSYFDEDGHLHLDFETRFTVDEDLQASLQRVADSVSCGAPGEGDMNPEEKACYDVLLVEVPDMTNKIMVIKVVREITGFGLKEAKDMVDMAPKVVRSGVPVEEARHMKEILEKAGGYVELR